MGVTRSTILRFVALVPAIVLVAGCGSATDGTAVPTQDAATPSAATTTTTAPRTAGDFDWIIAVLPNASELSHALGYQVAVNATVPPVGTIRDLRDTVLNIEKVTESQCLGVISPFGKRAFGAGTVHAATYATESTNTYGAVALATGDDARARTITFENQISQVNATNDVVSATVDLRTNSPTGVPVRDARALGVANDCIVEASIPVTDTTTSPVQSTNAAVDLVNVMLTKARMAPR